jgi:hypothetical protein
MNDESRIRGLSSFKALVLGSSPSRPTLAMNIMPYGVYQDFDTVSGGVFAEDFCPQSPMARRSLQACGHLQQHHRRVIQFGGERLKSTVDRRTQFAIVFARNGRVHLIRDEISISRQNIVFQRGFGSCQRK